jgi:hypothetical protein
MFRKIFSFSNATLLVALSLSTIAAWYSIIGLTAIFAGAVVPIIIMGTALEMGKIVTTVWLRKYWHRASFMLKAYLVPAVFFLAVLTSMGIFGFLSKAHMDQGIVSGDAVAKVSLYDEKIAIQKDIVKSSKSMLAQMDMQVNDIMTKGDSERSVERSVAIRKQQAKERANLQKDIENANKEIQLLNEQRAPLAAETRKIEAEVGPIKYIAALIYGDNPDQNTLEAAVRWVIIMLVAVFDPLALVLVIAANQSKEWDEHIEEEAELKEQVEHEKVMAELEEEPPVVWEGFVMNPSGKEVEEDLTDINHELAEAAVVEEPFIEVPEEDTRTTEEKYPYLFKPFSHFTETKPMVAEKPEVEEVVDQEEQVAEVPSLSPNPEPQILTLGIDEVERPGDYVVPPEETSPSYEGVKVNGEWVQTGPAFKSVIPEIKVSRDSDYIEYNGKKMHKTAFKAQHPELALEVDNPREPRTGFGLDFPLAPHIGDTFVKIDTFPNRVLKFNGKQWIELNRATTEAYLSNDQYLQFLVEKIATGEYDPELLTAQEEDAIREHIQGPKS